MEYYGCSDIGKRRQENQDTYLLHELPGGALLALVCDGMGGVAGGATASVKAAECFCHTVSRLYGERYRQSGDADAFAIKLMMGDGVEQACSSVYREAVEYPVYSGMGTTLSAVLLKENGSYYVANVGDSRVYHSYDENTICQITRDDSYVQDLIDDGRITATEARTHPQRHIITQAVGSQPKCSMRFHSGTLARGEKLLVCSDGLTNMVEDCELAPCIREGNAETAAKRLCDMANENGGADNITVVVLSL